MPEMGMGHSGANSIHRSLANRVVGSEVISLTQTWSKNIKTQALLTTEVIPPIPCHL